MWVNTRYRLPQRYILRKGHPKVVYIYIYIYIHIYIYTLCLLKHLRPHSVSGHRDPTRDQLYHSPCMPGEVHHPTWDQLYRWSCRWGELRHSHISQQSMCSTWHKTSTIFPAHLPRCAGPLKAVPKFLDGQDLVTHCQLLGQRRLCL